jgi:hypothetical protein
MAAQPSVPGASAQRFIPTPPRRIWKCQLCNHQFSVTSGTIFASRKLSIRDYLSAIAIFVNAVKGISALQLGRDLDVQYKTAFVLAHKLREAIGDEQIKTELSGVVEVDGAYFGGHSRQENEKAERKDRRLVEEQTGKRQSVVVARERGGWTVPFVVPTEAAAIPAIRQHVQPGTIVHAERGRRMGSVACLLRNASDQSLDRLQPGPNLTVDA